MSLELTVSVLLAKQPALRVHLSRPPTPTLGLQMLIAMSGFHVDAAHLNSGSYACGASGFPGSFHCRHNVHVLITHFLSPPPLDYEGFEVENLSHASLEMAILSAW